MFRSIFLLSLYLLVVGANHRETCEDEIARERKDDWRYHGCRACKQLPMDDSHCPAMGYDCDPGLPTTSNVLREGCECSQLRCADGQATLAVNGKLVRKLRCSDLQWTSSTGDVAPSGVCARKCDLGVCKSHPNDDGDSSYGPMDVRSPDGEHPCAWGTCDNGAVGSTGESRLWYDGPVEFSCAGDGKWKGPDGQKHDTVKCFLGKPCGKLPLWSATECSYLTTCEDPSIYNSIQFVCPGGRPIVFMYEAPGDYRYPKVECNTVIGEWVYDLSLTGLGGPNTTQEQFNALVPEERRKFSCN